MGGTYDVQQVCRNGHQITDAAKASPERTRPFCSQCGAPTQTECESCHQPIRGRFTASDSLRLTGTPKVPEHCSGCGAAFPWTGKQTKDRARENPWATLDGTLERVFDRFHRIQSELRQRHADRATLEISDEYDVQDLLRGLLCLFFDDVRPEEHAPSYGAGASRMDFLLKEQRAVVEVKRSRPTMKAKQLVDELTVDVARYSTHPDCQALFCFVYDPESQLPNPLGIERDLSRVGDGSSFPVRVFIRPKV